MTSSLLAQFFPVFSLTSQLLSTSDKSFWHGYLNFYERLLPKEINGTILEFGVFRGNSIRWLMQTFPTACILGADILATQPEWPVDPRVTYYQLDQGDEEAVRNLLTNIVDLDLIVEDGSHLPLHQSICLKHGLDVLRPGGTYVLEDIHTSHPAHELYRHEFGSERGQTAFSVLLGIEHLRRIEAENDDERLETLARGSHFTGDEIRNLAEQIDTVEFYRRATLPASCWNCGSSHFNYNELRCQCGVELFSEADSMTIVIRKRRSDAAR